MFGFGHTPELVILLVIAVIILGPKRLPEVGRGLGKMIGNFKHETAELRSEATSIRDELTSMKDVVKDDPKRETSATGQARSQ